MSPKRFALACLVLFVLALAWNGVVHLVLLRDANALVAPLHRPDLADRLWLSLVLTAAIVVLFAWGYRRFARDGSLREAIRYAVFFALLAGVLVDLNQYVLYPIPGWLAALWFVGGLVEFVLYGVVLKTLYGFRRG